MKAHYKTTFPCGYTIESDIETAPFELAWSRYKEPDRCPIHGRDCPPKKERRK